MGIGNSIEIVVVLTVVAVGVVSISTIGIKVNDVDTDADACNLIFEVTDIAVGVSEDIEVTINSSFSFLLISHITRGLFWTFFFLFGHYFFCYTKRLHENSLECSNLVHLFTRHLFL
jgi:hypothetical protein